MIELSTQTAVMLYLGLTLLVLFALWSYQHYKSRDKKVVLSEQELFVCEYCAFVYLFDASRPVNQCPQCKSFNKQNHFPK